MKRYLLSTTALTLLLFWPIQAQEVFVAPTSAIVLPKRLNTGAESSYLGELQLRRFSLETQGFLVESLDGSQVIAEHQSGVAFNPASVIKLATSFAALDRFGPDYRFETAFFADGDINTRTKTLEGDLILEATGDPILSTAQLTGLIREIIRLGVHRVNGNLVISGPFTFASYYTRPRAKTQLQTRLRALGVRVTGAVKDGPVRGAELARHTSDTLREILFEQNAFSTNATAERLGEVLGGPKAVEDFLVRAVGIPESDVHVGRTSGLDYNRITPRATIMLLRQMVVWLALHGMMPEDIMPVAGVDDGTLRTRFRSVDFQGAVVGKTGTLPVSEGGVSTLAGIAYTRDHGTLLFAIFNTKGPVNTYRKLQDQFLEDLIVELGGTPSVNASSRRSSN